VATDSAPLTPDEIDEIYRSLIQPTLFDGSPGGESAPTIVLLGGQPGSGKSRASTRLIAQHQGMIALSGDDLRIFHPHFRELVSDLPEQAGEVLAEATRPWVRSVLQDSLAGRRSLLLEGTFGDPDVTLATATRFRDAGYQVRVVAIASPRVLSLVTVASRYLRDRKAKSPARFTRLSAHDRGYDGTTHLIESLDAFAPIDQLTILSRNGNILFDRSRDNATASGDFDGGLAAMREGRHPASWGARSTMELLGELKQVTAYAISSGHLTADTARLLIEAHVLALAEIVPNLSIATESPQARFIQQAVSEQLVALRREATQSEPAFPDPSPEPEPAAARLTFE
jgi:hypothetical protein